VLKGPQGTLFGRNATGGAINIITPDPSDELSGDVDVEIGNYAQRKTMLYANVPIAKGLAASISGFASDQRNFYTNTAGPIIPIYSFGGARRFAGTSSTACASPSPAPTRRGATTPA